MNGRSGANEKEKVEKPMKLANHDEHRRRHKRAARDYLRAVVDDNEKGDALRIEAAAALLNAPGRWQRFVDAIAKVKPG